MLERFKKVAAISCLVAAEAMAWSPAAHANMSSVMTGMYTAMGNPSATDLPTGTALSLGYIATRNAIVSPNIIAFAPPNISAGCGGINMFFGSWSFINSQQLQQLLTAIGQAAGPFLFQMAIQAMCSQCSSILNNLSDAMQKMNQMAHNSCQLAAGIYSGKGLDMLRSASNSAAGVYKAASGAASDFFSSMFGDKSTTKDPSSTWQTYLDNVATAWGYSALGSSTTPPQAGTCADMQLAGNAAKFGNMTWKALVNNNASSAFGSDGGLGNGAQTDEILMSLVGTTIVLPSPPKPAGATGQAPAGTNPGANGADTANTSSPGAGQTSPYSLTLDDLVTGRSNAVVMRCNTIKAPDGVTYDATNGTCPKPGPLSPLGCMNVTADPQQTLETLGYVGIKNVVHCALFGEDVNGASPGVCANIPGGAPAGILAAITGSNPAPNAWNNTTQQQVLLLSPINFLPLVRPVSKYPDAVKHILLMVQPYIVANIAYKYGVQVLAAIHQGFQNNAGGWVLPEGFSVRMQQLSNDVEKYNDQMNGSVQTFNQLREYVNSYTASLHQPVPGANP